MEAKHTPGDWFSKREGFSTVYVFSRIGGGLVQEVAACGPTIEGQDQQEANARLIAAAPKLLDALQSLKERLDACRGGLSMQPHEVFDSFYEQVIDAAIAKATGVQP